MVNFFKTTILFLIIISANSCQKSDMNNIIVGTWKNMKYGNDLVVFDRLGARSIDIDSATGKFVIPDLEPYSILTFNINKTQKVDYYFRGNNKDSITIDGFLAINNFPEVYEGFNNSFENNILNEIHPLFSLDHVQRIEMYDISTTEFLSILKDKEQKANNIIENKINNENSSNVNIELLENYIIYKISILLELFIRHGNNISSKEEQSLKNLSKSRFKLNDKLVNNAFYSSYLINSFKNRIDLDATFDFQNLMNKIESYYIKPKSQELLVYYSIRQKYYDLKISTYEDWLSQATISDIKYTAKLNEILKDISNSDINNIASGSTFIGSNGGEATIEFEDNKTYFIDMWATWCGPCIKEMEVLDKKIKNSKMKDVEIIAISFDRNLKIWKKAIDSETNPNIKHFLVNDSFKSSFAKILNVTALPRYLVVKNGTIVKYDALRPSNSDFYNQF